MWIIRFLNGPKAGQIVPLTKHSTLIGRAPNCDIKVANANVSKEHTRLEVFDDKLIITDAGSRNGTFINGVQVRSSKAKSGDKIAIHDIYFEVQKVPDSWAARFQNAHAFGAMAGAAPGYEPMPSRRKAQVNYDGDDGHGEPARSSIHHTSLKNSEMANELLAGRFPKLQAMAQEYLDRVVLPGLYKLPEMFDFKWVLAGFMAAFILLVTSLSTIPLVRILKTSIEEESQHHAMTIATTLARINRPYLVDGQISAASVDAATTRPGVKRALLISALDGSVVAPAALASSYQDIPFMHEGRKGNKEVVRQINDNTVVAMYPIAVFNQDTGQQAVTHWAVVEYDMASLAVNDGQVLSLFITTLFFALVLGLALFFILYKIIEFPVRSLNEQLDVALKEGGETVSVTYQFPAIQLLAANVSSALTRAVNGAQDAHQRKGGLEHDRNREVGNLVELIGFAAMGIRAHDLSLAAVNQACEQRLNLSSAELLSQSVNDLADQALKLSIKDLIERVDKDPDNLASNDLEFSGINYQIVAQAVFGTQKVAYYLVVLLPKEGGA